jgi:O-antigen/teichoic acid export membrane protein
MTEVKTEKPAAFHSSRGDSTRTIGRNTIFGIVASLVQMGTRLITVPIVIGHLGLDGYGIWSIIMTTAAYMRFGSVGIKSAFQKYVAEATGSGDFERANRLLSTGTAVLLGLSIVGLIPIAIFSRSLARVSGVPPQFLDSTAGAISLLAIIMVLSNGAAVYEGIVMGAHRIDLTRKFGTVFTVLEAVAIVLCLHLGYGLIAMSAIMAISEVGYLFCCFIASRRVLSAVRVGIEHLNSKVLPELVRFAGSYQLVNILEILYGAILPVAVLKFFGANAAGVFAIASRLVQAAFLPQEAFLGPILSSSSMVYASGSPEKIRQLLMKAFKMTLVLTLLPVAFVASQGTTIIMAWTGQSDPLFRVGLWLTCLAGVFRSLSLLQLVLYRSAGKTVMDNLRQVLRILLLLVISAMVHRLGFGGILAGLALTEFVGMVFMFFAMTHAFQEFRPSLLIPDSLRLAAAILPIVLVGIMVTSVPLPWSSSARMLATIRLGGVCLVTAVVAWPALLLTGALSQTERGAILDVFRRRAA